MNYQKIVDDVYKQVTDSLIKWAKSNQYRLLNKNNLHSMFMSHLIQELKRYSVFHSKKIKNKITITHQTTGDKYISVYNGSNLFIHDAHTIDLFKNRYNIDLQLLCDEFNRYRYSPLHMVVDTNESLQPDTPTQQVQTINNVLDLSQLRNFSFTLK